jgi:Zn ribbon nucleic-acid-binding protein
MLNKLNNIVRGWAGYVWETPEVKALAEKRAVACADCPNAEWGLIAQLLEDDVTTIKGLKCSMCDCPLSTKLRSKEEVCPLAKW